MLKESFLGQWQSLIFPRTRRKRPINNKPLCLAATWHLNINSVYVKYFYITTLKALNKCQGLKNYHSWSLNSTVWLLQQDFQTFHYPGLFFPGKIVSSGTIERAVCGLRFANFITIYDISARLLTISTPFTQLKFCNFSATWTTQSGIFSTVQSRIRVLCLDGGVGFYHQ